MELAHHPFSPSKPALQLTIGQRDVEWVGFPGLHCLLPCLPVTFPVNLVWGLVHLMMPIQHG
jgi:hypothetical protein